MAQKLWHKCASIFMIQPSDIKMKGNVLKKCHNPIKCKQSLFFNCFIISITTQLMCLINNKDLNMTLIIITACNFDDQINFETRNTIFSKDMRLILN